MAKLIQKSGFLSKNRAGRYMNYIATRDGVEILEEDADSIYLRYIATRPRTEKHSGHGLFGAERCVDLDKTLQELKQHEGSVWTIIPCAVRTQRDLVMTGQKTGAPCFFPSRVILQQPCRFQRSGFAGMRLFTMKVSIPMST